MYKVIKYKFSCYDFVERDPLEWLAGLEPGHDGYGNESDRAESGNQLSDEDESDEDELTHAVPFKCIGAAELLMRKTTKIIWNRHAVLFMDKINQ